MFNRDGLYKAVTFKAYIRTKCMQFKMFGILNLNYRSNRMNKLLLSIMTVAMTATLAISAMAGTRDHRVNQRQHNQHERIGQGVKSGELTKDEAKDLRTDQKSIRQEEQQFKSDGTMTKDERQELHQDQNAASKEIYQEKHDEQERPRAK
jgi:Ni/Co efflux regulator RcnB